MSSRHTAAGGKEYVTILGPGQSTPLPWINVIANPAFGFQVATEGVGYTWSINSRENQLTPWSNDPVTDRAGEALYVQDDDTGDLWSPTALPIRDELRTIRQGLGRNAASIIANRHRSIRRRTIQGDFDIAPRRSVPNRIPENVLDRAPQQLRIGPQLQMARPL